MIDWTVLKSSTDGPKITALAALAALTLLVVPALGGLMFSVGRGAGQLVGQLDPTCNAVLNPGCLSATAQLFFGAAEVGLLLMFSPLISWLGMLMMTPMAAILFRLGLGGYLTFIATGSAVGIGVAEMMLTDWDIAELGGMTTFAVMGAGYAFVFWLLVQFSAKLKAQQF